ncbi:MAG TPA: PKD domain-containing protein, partial [Candidatus Cloacimonadota bacterium]|nr:PKD domain-containing protein [Candidatus Cloacimonadota bacterium]
MQKTALSKMILQMQSTVKVDISDDQTERDGKIQGELRQTIAMSSQIKLTNFKYISYSDKNNKYMLAYMNKTAYKTWLDAESERIKSRMQEAIEKEDILGLGDIIPIYLNLYAQTLLIPQAIMYENKADLNLYLYDILYEYLKESRKRSNVQKPNPQTPDIYPVSFDVRYMQMPVNNVKLAFDSDKIYKVVVGGNAELYIDGHSSVQKKTEKVVMTYDTQLAELADNIKGILDEHPIIYTFNEDLDFSKLVKVDFEIIQDGAEVCLTPIASNISVNEIQWQFGDDSYPITETKPKYKYNKNGKYTVTLTINRAVSVSKVIVVNDNALIEKQEIIAQEKQPIVEKEKEIV